jgi:diacylglycerol kinase family enzyme
VTAIGALVVAVLAVVVGVTSNLGVILGAVVCLAVLGIAGWYVVTRSHTSRVVATVVLVGALAALVALVVTADADWWRLGVAIVAAGLSIAAAERALRPPSEQRLVAMIAAAPPAERPVLIMNPRSGGGKVERFQLVDECRRRGIEPVLLNPGDDLVQLAEDAIARGADVIGMAGGDGSQALVAGIASRHGIPMVVIPAGTRNHFALDIGLDRDDVVGALDAYAEGLERRIDLATVNGRVFVNNASLGLYARIVQSPGYREAKLQTTAAMLPQMLGPGAQPFDLRYTGPDGTERRSAHLVMVANNPYHLESPASLGTRGRLDGGVLGIAAATIANAADWERLLALEATGRLGRFPGLLQWTAPEFEIRSDDPVEIGIDGEALVMEAPLDFKSLPGALRLRVPSEIPGAPGAKRRARLLWGSTMVELGRVAAGRPPGGPR